MAVVLSRVVVEPLDNSRYYSRTDRVAPISQYACAALPLLCLLSDAPVQSLLQPLVTIRQYIRHFIYNRVSLVLLSSIQQCLRLRPHRSRIQLMWRSEMTVTVMTSQATARRASSTVTMPSICTKAPGKPSCCPITVH